MEWIATLEWETFIAIEISLLIAFFSFALFRYGLHKRRVSFLFLFTNETSSLFSASTNFTKGVL